MVSILRARLRVAIFVWLAFTAACYAAAASEGEIKDSKVAQVGVVCPTSDSQALASYNGALQLQGQGRTDEAEALYRKAIDKDGRYCDAMDNLGQLLRRKGELADAIYWYKRSVAVKPNNQTAHQDLAVAYKFQRNLDAAQEEYLWLIQNAPLNPEGFYGLGTVLIEKKEYDAAIENLTSAERIYLAGGSPYVGDARHAMGIAYFQKKDCLKAREYLLQAYTERQDDAGINYMLGVCYLDPATGDKKKASEYLLKAKRLGTNLPPNIMKQLEQ